MTPQELELSKIKKLEELSKPSVYKGKPVASFTVEKYIDGSINTIGEGPVIDMIALALNGIHEIETKYPASKMIIDEAFKAYSEMRDEEE